ncbi:MAG: protoporphyrinogen oxidase [Planctomycetes bacterium]|nr:protoporphyrinogen oxidase [Planctomycetota bacterium]
MNASYPPASAAPRIAVIGGGITGLAAAHRLHELLPRAEVALFEAGPRVGGVLDTAHLDGFLVERSADNFLTRLPQAVALCRRVGLADELLSTDETRRRAFVVKNGQLVPIPDGFFLMSPRKLGPLLGSNVLSVPGKLRLLAETFVPRGPASKELNPEPRTLNPPDESVASFARRRLGNETFERLVQPLVAGIYTADPEKLSMAATMPEFLAQERDHGSLLRARRRAGRFRDQSDDSSGARYSLFAAPKDGMASLVQALVARISPSAIHLNAPIESVRQMSDGRWQLDFGFRISDFGLAEGSFNPQSRVPSGCRNPQSAFDALILAVPAYAAAELLRRHDPTLATELATIEYAGCAVVSLAFQRNQIGHALDGFGFVVPQVERRRIIAASFASQKFPGRAPEGAALIRVFIGGALQPELLDLPDHELRQLALDELRDLLQITGEPLLTDIARWPRSMPQYHVGHLDRIARIEELAARHPTLALAGNAYRGVGIPQCIASAESAAERLATPITP